MEQVVFSLVLLAIVFIVLFLYGCLRCLAVASVDSTLLLIMVSGRQFMIDLIKPYSEHEWT